MIERASALERMAYPMRPSARGVAQGRRRRRGLDDRLIRDINRHFERGPSTLRPHLRPQGIETVSVRLPSQLSGMDDFRVIPDVGDDDQLGFSLKPPKWLRKASVAIRRNVTLKRTLAVAGGVAAVALAPVAFPAIAAGARFIGREFGAGARYIGTEAGRLFSSNAPEGPPAPSDYPSPEGPPMPTTPTAGPPLMLPPGGGGGESGGMDTGPLMSPDTGDEGPPTTAGPSGPTSPTTGLLIAGGLVLATVMLSRIKKRRAA